MKYLQKLFLAACALAFAPAHADQYLYGYGWSGGNGTTSQCLVSNGPNSPPSFQACTATGGSGTVTSVAAGSGLVASPSPIVSSGSLSLDLAISQAFSGIPTYASTEPRIKFDQTGAGTDQKFWDFDVASLIFCLRTRTDADAAGVNVLCATRGTTTALSALNIGNATSNAPINFLGTGTATFSGSVVGPNTSGSSWGGVRVTGGSVGNAVTGIYLSGTNTLGFATNSVFRGSFDANGIFLTTSGIIEAVRSVTAAGAIAQTGTDRHICVNKTTGAATAVGLVAGPSTGAVITVDDCKGDAATNNITITPAAGNIDGSATYVISTAYGSWTGVYTGTIWKTEASR